MQKIDERSSVNDDERGGESVTIRAGGGVVQRCVDDRVTACHHLLPGHPVSRTSDDVASSHSCSVAIKCKKVHEMNNIDVYTIRNMALVALGAVTSHPQIMDKDRL